MTRRRFIVAQFDKGRARLEGEQARHLGRVLRVRPGQRFELSDGREIWLGEVTRASPRQVDFLLVEKVTEERALPSFVLLAGLIKFNRWEWMLEKAAEFGVTEIVPLAAGRSVKRLVQAAPGRVRRWEKILLNAAQQARRTAPPALAAVAEPAAALARVEAQVKVFLSEDPRAPLLRTLLGEAGSALTSCALAVGPEGGWTEGEQAAGHAAGFRAVSLGGNILRAETAVLAALAIVGHQLAAG